MRRFVKSLFRRCGMLPLFDALHFCGDFLLHAPENARFRLRHPGLPMPPLRWMHETYRCDLKRYWEDGRTTSEELIAHVRPYLDPMPGGWNVLDWGCGTGRITRHLTHIPEAGSVTGADVHAGMIRWNQQHLSGIRFIHLPDMPPMPLPSGHFHVIIGISVLTHIPTNMQRGWLDEMYRLLQPGGIFLFTTHGSAFDRLMDRTEREELRTTGCITQSYPKAGHRMMTTLHDARTLSTWLWGSFEILSLIEGRSDPCAAGGQDLWILRHLQKD